MTEAADRTMELPDHIAEQVDRLPESSYGATTVALTLADGREVAPVVVAWGSTVVRVGGRDVNRPEQLDFELKDVVAVRVVPRRAG